MAETSSRFSLKSYKKVLKEEGWKGLLRKAGWKVAILLFLFFLIKGLIWLAIFYGGFELVNNMFK